MALCVKDNVKVGVAEEADEGVYETFVGADFVQALSDNLALTPSIEMLERNIVDGSIGKTTPRVGAKTVAGTVGVEFKASGTEGTAPEAGPLVESAMGTVHTISAQVTTKASGNTASVLHIEDADIAKFAVGDIIKILEAGVFYVSPVTVVTTTGGAATITLGVAGADAFPNSVVIEKSVTYKVANSGHPSFSVAKYLEDAVLESAWGCRATSMELVDFAVGQNPKLNFGFEGMGYNREVSALSVTPAYDAGLPPIVLSAVVLQDGVAVCVNNVSLTVANTLAWVTCVSAASGRDSSRVSMRDVTGSFNPYREDDSVADYTKWAANTEFSLFLYAYIPSATAGEFADVVAVWLPQCVIESITEGDQNGLLTDEISFRATRGVAGTTDEMSLAFI